MVLLIFFTRSKRIFSFVKPLYFDNTQCIIIDCAGTRHNTIINSDNQININTSSYFLQYKDNRRQQEGLRFSLMPTACTH